MSVAIPCALSAAILCATSIFAHAGSAEAYEAKPAASLKVGDSFDAFALRSLRDLYSTDVDIDPRSPLTKRTYTASLLAADAKAAKVAEARNEPWGTVLTKRYGQDLEPVVSKSFDIVGPDKAAVTLRLKPLDAAAARLERYPTRTETVVYSFAKDGGSWKVDDVSFVDARGHEVADARFLVLQELALGKPLSRLPLEPGRYEGDSAEYTQGEAVGTLIVGENGRDIHVIDARSHRADDCVTERLAWVGEGHAVALSSRCGSRARELSVQALTRRSMLLDGHVYRLPGIRPSEKPAAATSAGIGDSGPKLAALEAGKSEHPSEDDVDIYEHNGSIVNVFPNRGLMTYHEPKKSMQALVKANDVLFSSTIGTEKSSGTAYVFKRGCPPLGFHVEGSGIRSDAFVLKGEAPVRSGSSCSPSSAATRVTVLRFEPAGAYAEDEYNSARAGRLGDASP